MKFASVRELKNKTSEILRLAEYGDIIVTSNGNPKAIIKGITEDELEDYLLENNPKFLNALEKARNKYLIKDALDIKDYLIKRGKKRG